MAEGERSLAPCGRLTADAPRGGARACKPGGDATAEPGCPPSGIAARAVLTPPWVMAQGFGGGGEVVAGGETGQRRQGRQYLIGSEEYRDVPWCDVCIFTGAGVTVSVEALL